jgi:hypothetical protein
MPDTRAASAALARKGAETRRRFIEQYLIDGSVAKAARAAGISAKRGSDILHSAAGQQMLDSSSACLFICISGRAGHAR